MGEGGINKLVRQQLLQNLAGAGDEGGEGGQDRRGHGLLDGLGIFDFHGKPA